MAVTEITIPYSPRPLQAHLHDALEANRFVAAVCHRRFGKTVMAVNHLIKGALTCTRPRPRFAYIAPTFTQGKQIAWDYLKHFSQPIPGHVVNESELRIDYPNGGQVRIYGADNPDRLRGIYLDGAVLDEYGLQPPRIFTEVVMPTLSDRGGWALFIGTPNGKNQFYDVVQKARAGATGWAFAEFRASQTGYVAQGELHTARAEMTADEYAQEYECSFEAAVKGAIYAREVQAAREAGRITNVPYEPMLPVDTYWDLGIDDSNAIWFGQSAPGGEVRLIDYDEDAGKGLDHYARVIKGKPYTYGNHYGPHDIQIREYSTGRSRIEIAASLGLPFVVVPKLSIEDGVNACRMLLPKCWFDAERCADGLECLKHYKWDFNTRIQEHKTWLPVHDWASHGADAFRVLGVSYFQPRVSQKRPVERDVDRYDNYTRTGAYTVPHRTQHGRGPRGGY